MPGLPFIAVELPHKLINRSSLHLLPFTLNLMLHVFNP
ncbi:hypothetical protein B0F88_103332 [Methylobacter tundripaludum]|uniref:Uncharacterized protein n=1 Tax=Methylobacter tundripaludum TaxID=173365 RepID=A0A2S6H5Y8_9GAMM|nr:hypothetical protein B0F88_103332 [Methylobacter tundripaludum]